MNCPFVSFPPSHPHLYRLLENFWKTLSRTKNNTQAFRDETLPRVAWLCWEKWKSTFLSVPTRVFIMKGRKFMRHMKNFIFINPWSLGWGSLKKGFSEIPYLESIHTRIPFYIHTRPRQRPNPTHISILSIPFSIVVLARACSVVGRQESLLSLLPPSKNFIVIIRHHFPSCTT